MDDLINNLIHYLMNNLLEQMDYLGEKKGG